MIPLLMYLYAGQWIDVPVLKLFMSTLQIIIFPVLLGLGVRAVLKEKIRYVLPILPSVSAIAAMVEAVPITAHLPAVVTNRRENKSSLGNFRLAKVKPLRGNLASKRIA